MQQKPETPEEMEKRIRAELEKPPDAPPNFQPSGNKPQPQGKMGMMKGMQSYIAMAIVSLIVSYLVMTFVGVPRNLEVKDINDLKNSVNAISVAEQGIQASVAEIGNTINGMKGTEADASGRLSTVSSQMSGLQNNILTLQNQLKQYATSDQLNTANGNITADQSAIAKLQTTLTALQTTLTADEASIKALQTQSTSTTTSTSGATGSSSTYKNVTAMMVNNGWTNTNYVGTSTIPTIGVSLPFSFTLDNETGKDISNISLVMGFYVVNSASSAPLNLPSTVTASLSTVGMTPQWVSQSTGSANILAFSTSSSGTLFNLFNFTQGKGIATYTINLTLATSGSDLTGTTYLFYPIIKVVGFTQ